MNREEVVCLIFDRYSVEPDCPWQDENLVFRHTPGRKWFAVILHVTRQQLGLPGPGELDILNIKCDPFLAGSVRKSPGILPAWHMNKSHWLTLMLDGTAGSEDILFLL